MGLLRKASISSSELTGLVHPSAVVVSDRSIERQGRGTNVSRGESDDVGIGLGRGRSGCEQRGRRGQGANDVGRGPGTWIQHLLQVEWQLAAAAQSRWRDEIWKEKEPG